MEFRIVFICVFISLLEKCDAQGVAATALHGAGKEASLVPSVCRKDVNGTSLSVEIRLPFMDMELHHEGRLHVLQDQQLLFVLHGHELFQWHIGSQDKRLVRLGQLEGRVRQQLSVAAAIVLWHEDLLLAVALDDILEFYQLPQEQLLNTTQWHLSPIQEFSLPGTLQQLHLLKTKLDQVVLLLTVNSTQTQSKCITFEWMEAYFNPVGELNLPPIKAFQVVGHQPHYIITGRSLRSQSVLVLSVFELETPSLRLRRRQSLTVHARHVLAARFRGRNHLIACGTNATAACLLFRMVDGNFVVYRKHMLRQLHFSHLRATELGQLLVGARINGEVLIFNSHRLDCYSGFGGDPNPTDVFTHRNPQNETFLLLAYRRQDSITLLRMVQLGGANDAAILGANFDGNDDLSSVQQHRHEFEESVNGLRSLLLRQKQQVDALRRLTQSQQRFEFTKQLHLQPGDHVEQVHLQGQHLQSPTQLKGRIEHLRQQHVINRRPVRSFGVGNDSSSAGQEMLKVRRLHVQNLIYNGELMPGYYLDTSGPPILTIKGQLLTRTLDTQQLLAPQSYERPSRSVEVDSLEQQKHLVVQHLHVARINNVSWFDFYDSLFLPSRDNHIEGRLIVQSRARVVNLETPLINGLVVQKLFNLRQPQIVASNIFMSAFFVSKLDANFINGLDFANDIVFRGDNETTIKSPVHIYQMSVSVDLFVANDTKWKRQMTSEESSKTLNRLQQYYTGKVILNGSLTVYNVKRDMNATVLQLGDQSLRREDLHSNYLLVQEEQNLTSLAFGHAKVTTPVLNSVHINGHPVAEHLLNKPGDQKKVEDKKPLHIIFMAAKIEGDVYCTNYNSRLAQLSKDAVRQGDTATITGYKQFEAPLTVESLSSQAINGIEVNELVLKSQSSQNFTNLKQFERIVVKYNANIGDNLIVGVLNSLPITQLLEPGYSLQRLELPEKPKLQELNFQRLNNLPFDELLGKIRLNDSQPDQTQLLLHKQLIIEGNVKFKRELQLNTINDIHWDDYMSRLVNANANVLISGKKSFHQQVLVTDALETPSINGLDLSALLDNTLLRSTPQSIGGSYSFDRMIVGNLDVPGINGVPANSFLNTRQSEVRLQGDLYVDQLTINGSLNCNLFNNPLPHLHAQLATLQQRPWSKIYVLGDALWPEESHTHLDYLRQHAVRRGGATQTITGHVILQQPQLGSIKVHQEFPGNLNLSYIASDALLRRAPFTQIIQSPQEMLQPVRTRSINLHNDCHFGELNHIDPIRLNASLYRISSRLPIVGQLRFMVPPILEQLRLHGQVNEGNIDGIFQQSPNVEWPPIQMRQLQVKQHLELNEINGMDLHYLLQHRVPLRSDTALELFGTLTFDDLVLGERAMLRTINGIPLQNVVYKHSQRLQSISGAKTFEKGIDLLGPAHIMHLNGKDLSDSYQQSIFTDRDYSIDSLVLDGASFEGGLLHGESPTIGESRQAQSTPGQELRQQLQQLEQQLRITQEKHNKRLLYLDYEQESFEVSWNTSGTGKVYDLEAVILPEQSSNCQLKELRAQLSRSQQRVHLSNVSIADRLKRISSQNGTIRVKVQNNCGKSKSKFRGRIHINCRGQVHNLGMRQYVEDLQMHEEIDYSLLLISTLDEVRVLRVDASKCSLSDWQSIQPAAGRIMRLVQINSESVILLTSALHQHLPAVAVHRLSVESQRFEFLQLIEGDYDLVELQEQQLLLSCHRCHHIDIHIFNPLMQRFQSLQQLRLEARIQQLLPFIVGMERHLLVLTMRGSTNFYLLSYTHIGGWQQCTYGHMTEVLWSLPLIRSGSHLTTTTSMMLLCGELQCRLVKALLD